MAQLSMVLTLAHVTCSAKGFLQQNSPEPKKHCTVKGRSRRAESMEMAVRPMRGQFRVIYQVHKACVRAPLVTPTCNGPKQRQLWLRRSGWPWLLISQVSQTLAGTQSCCPALVALWRKFPVTPIHLHFSGLYPLIQEVRPSNLGVKATKR